MTKITTKLSHFSKNIAFYLYEMVFKEKVSDEVRSFLSNLLYVSAGALLSSILLFVFNILAGRMLGPSGYGEFALVQSVSAILFVPMLLGFHTAMVKYVSEHHDAERNSIIITAACALTLLFTIAFAILYITFHTRLSNLLSVSNEAFYLSIIFAILVVFYTLATSALRGLFMMRVFAFFQPIFAAISLFAFLLFVFNNFLSFKTALYSQFLAYGITAFIILIFFLRKYLRFEFNSRWAYILTRYSMFSAIGMIASAFYANVDRIIINRSMSTFSVGIYGAYYLASMAVASFIWLTFNTVFFPTVSKYKDKSLIFAKVDKSLPYLIGLGFPSVVLSEYIILKLYGAQYPFQLNIALLFGIAAVCVIVDNIYAWALNAVGVSGVKIISVLAVGIAVTNAALNIWLVPLLGLEGAVIAIIFPFLLSIIIVFSTRDYVIKAENQ